MGSRGVVCVRDQDAVVVVGAGASAKAKRAAEEMFEYDAVAQTLTRKDKPSDMLKVFDAVRDAWVARQPQRFALRFVAYGLLLPCQVKVRIEVQTRVNHSQVLVYALEEPFEAPLAPPGATTSVEVAAATAETAAPATAVSADAGEGTAKGKAQRRKKKRRRTK